MPYNPNKAPKTSIELYQESLTNNGYDMSSANKPPLAVQNFYLARYCSAVFDIKDPNIEFAKATELLRDRLLVEMGSPTFATEMEMYDALIAFCEQKYDNTKDKNNNTLSSPQAMISLRARLAPLKNQEAALSAQVKKTVTSKYQINPNFVPQPVDPNIITLDDKLAALKNAMPQIQIPKSSNNNPSPRIGPRRG